MSVFNYKAEFIEQNETYVFYTFYPDYIGLENISGKFQIKLDDWKTTILSGTKIRDWDSIYCNDRPVGALTYKIKKYVEENGNFPKQVYHNA